MGFNMQRKKNIADAILIWVCVGFLMLMMCFIAVRFLTGKIAVEKLKMNNFFTKAVFFDCDVPSESKTYISDESERDTDAEQESTEFSKCLQKIRDNADRIKKPAEEYSSDRLPGYSYFTTGSRAYESWIKWNFTQFEEYNSIVKIGKNYFFGPVQQRDVTQSAQSTAELAEYLKSRGKNFLYVQMPSKISKYEDTNISGTTDFSNQNADSLLKMLEDADVEFLDLREEIKNQKLTHHELFYETDHHWKSETGLWAAGRILEKMKDLGFSTDSESVAADKFEYVVYKDWFLGSQGKKATLAQATPEDISLIYPKFETRFKYVIPNMGIDTVGDFSVTYWMEHIEKKDYMKYNPYASYNHADQPLIKIENELAENEHKVLIIHNSFANCVIPFVALDVKNVDAIDLRFFDGSIKSYIDETDPDIVIVAYPCDVPGAVDPPTGTDMFNFE